MRYERRWVAEGSNGIRSSPLPQSARVGRARARERSRATTFTEVAMPWHDGPYKGRPWTTYLREDPPNRLRVDDE